MQAIKQICEEKQLSVEAVLETVEAALAAAFRKDFGQKNQNVKIIFDPESGNMRAFDVKTVVEDALYETFLKEEEERRVAAEEAEKLGLKPEISSAPQPSPRVGEGVPVVAPAEGEVVPEEPVFNPKLNISLSEAKKIKKDAVLAEEIRVELEIPAAFGRMAAMTAKQVITQRLREAERTMVYNEMKQQEGALVNGIVQRREGRLVLIDLGRIAGVMPPEEQIAMENYAPGERIKVYVVAVNVTARGPQVVVSRASEQIVRKLFTLEIPEVSTGTVVLHNVAREAGSRSKVSVSSSAPNIDPIGSCIGQRGTRIQTIIAELGGEKVDIIQYNENQEQYIALALAPAKVSKVDLNDADKMATVTVPTDQLSLAIGKGGQNVRLAAKLTGWKINIVEEGKEAIVVPEGVAVPESVPAETPAESPIEAPAAEAEKPAAE
jgi:N utilization substance protein A